jgi:hypothetical protein
MAHKLSIAVDDDVYEYIESRSGGNRSAFVVAVMREHKRESLRRELARQYEQYALDEVANAEFGLWEEATIADGLEESH